MNALDSQRALLDSLMGVHRDNDDDEPVDKMHWRDEDVCKYYLCGFCPHDLFVNTKSDLGPCDKIHDDQLRREFSEERDSTKDRYERRFLAFLQDIVYLLERKIQRGRARINLEASQDSSAEDNLTNSQRDRLDEIEDKIEDFTAEMEELGNEGKVEEAQDLLLKVENLKKESQTLKAAAQSGMQDPSKKLSVCDVCGAFLMNDAESRSSNPTTDAHLSGRTHTGFQLVRDKIDELLEKQEKRRNESRSRSRSRSRSKRRKKRSRRSSRSRSRKRSKKSRRNKEEDDDD